MEIDFTDERITPSAGSLFVSREGRHLGVPRMLEESIQLKTRRPGVAQGWRPVIRDLVRAAGRLVRHARRWTLRFAKSALRLDWLIYAANMLDGLARAPT